MAMRAPRQTGTFWRRRRHRHPIRRMLLRLGWPLTIALGLVAGFVFGPNIVLLSLDEESLIENAEAELAAGNPYEARADALKALEKEPGSAEAYLLLAKAEIVRRDGPAAIAALDAAHDLGIPGERLHAYLGEARLIDGDVDAAEEALQAKIVESDLGLANRLLARIALERGQVERAGPLYRLALRFSPEDPGIWADYALYHDHRGDSAAAREAIGKALEYGPGDIRTLEIAGQLAERWNGPARAIDYYRRGLARSPDDLRLLDSLARALGATGRHREMLETARHMLSVDPTSGRAYYLLGWIAERGGKPALAEGLLDRVQDETRRLPAFMLLSAITQYRLGHYGDAAATIETLIERRPHHVPARRLLAASQIKAGGPLAALDTLQPLMTSGEADGATMRLVERARAAAGRSRSSEPDRAAIPASG